MEEQMSEEVSVTTPSVARDPLSLAGGLDGLRAHLSEFYRRVFRDPMIGYLFMGQDQARLVERELEWTARAFGAELPYQGRPLRAAHAQHPIRRGHFFRRNQLLLDTLKERGAPEELIEEWMSHSRALEAAILGRAAGVEGCEVTSDE